MKKGVKPTVKQRKYAAGVVSGKSKRQSALDAGYPESMANCAGEKIDSKPSMQKLFIQLLEKAGITDELLAQRIREGIDAEETVFAKFEGRITDEQNVVSWSERRAYVEMAARLKGHVVDRSVVAGDPDAPLAAKLVLVDAGQDTTAK